jgi:hypothetical protein
MARQCGTELADRRDEHEVEVELEPRRVPLLAQVGGRAQPRRLQSKRPARG